MPLIVVWQEKITAGTTNDQPVSNIDFYPTLLEIAGISKPADYPLDGTSMWPALQGKQLAGRALFWHFPIYLQGGNDETSDPYFRTRPGSVIRQGPWKLHEYFEDGRLELYNLNTGIGERKNLKEIYPEKTNELYRALREWRNSLEAPLPHKLNPEYQVKSDR